MSARHVAACSVPSQPAGSLTAHRRLPPPHQLPSAAVTVNGKRVAPQKLVRLGGGATLRATPAEVCLPAVAARPRHLLLAGSHPCTATHSPPGCSLVQGGVPRGVLIATPYLLIRVEQKAPIRPAHLADRKTYPDWLDT